MTIGERTFRIVTYASKTSPVPVPLELDLDSFYGLFEVEIVDCVMPDGSPGCRGKRPSKEEQCPQKDGFAWSPGFISATAIANGKTRFNRNIEGLDFAVFDLDDKTREQVAEVIESFDGVDIYVHTTHTHLSKRGPANWNVRLIIPLTRTVSPEEWRALWPTIQKTYKFEADKGTKDPSRLSFLPRSPRGRENFSMRQKGALLDPQPLLANNLLASRLAARAAAASSPAPEPGSVNMEDLRQALRRYNPQDDTDGEKKEMVQRVLDGEAFMPQGRRGKAVTVLAGIVGKLMPHGTPIGAVLELLRPSLAAAMLPDDDVRTDSVEAWSERIESYFTLAQEEKFSQLAEQQTAAGRLARIIQQRDAARLAAAPARGPVPRASAPRVERASAVALAAAAAVEDDEMRDDKGEWRLDKTKMINITDKAGRTLPKNTFANIDGVLRHHAAWKGVFRYNLITNESEVIDCRLFTPAECTPERLVTNIRNWLARREGLEQSQTEVATQIDNISRDNLYDPLRTYLLEQRWDGVPRIGNWLIRYCGARVTDDAEVDVAEYVRTVGQKWLMSGAARGLYPGCKADNVLVLEGEQYAGKSMALSILGGEWFVDTKLTLHDKTALELTAKSWIIEMAELASMKKSETESQKAFFSTSADSFRLSYAPRVRKYPRRCIFAGTTNETKYLLDLTGNRRFWCVWCDKIDVEALRRDRDQLWAEAVAIVRAGENCSDCTGVATRCPQHRWWLDDAMTQMTELVSTSRLKSGFEEIIRTWWVEMEPLRRPQEVAIELVLTEALKMEPADLERNQKSIGIALKALGFAHKQKWRAKNDRPWFYYPSERLKAMPKEGSSGMSPRFKLLTNIARAEVRT